MKTKNSLLTVIIAATAGAMLGILIAPDKGSRTRKKVLNTTTDFKDELLLRAQIFLETLSGKEQRSNSSETADVENTAAEIPKMNLR